MRAINCVSVLLLVILLSGCASLKKEETGNRSPDYVQGVLTRTYDADILKAYEASIKALTDLAMTIRKSNKNERKATIIATRPDDMERVVVTFHAQNPNESEALIKVGTDGDEPYSRLVAKRIAARLRG